MASYTTARVKYPLTWDDWTVVQDNTWSSWNITYTTTSATITAPQINYQAAYTNATTTGTLWGNWVQRGQVIYTPQHDEVWAKWSVRDVPIPQVNDELRAQRELERQRQADERQRQREEISRRRLAAVPILEGARSRATELLMMLLTPEERLYRENNEGQVLVRGGDTGQLYIVDTSYGGVHGNIWETDEHGCKLATLCVAPEMNHTDEHGDRYALPLEDGYVGQILTIKNNETALRQKANFSFRRDCQHPGIPILGEQRVA